MGKKLTPLLQRKEAVLGKNLKIFCVICHQDQIVGNRYGCNLSIKYGGRFPQGNKSAGYICIDLCCMIIIWNDREGGLHIVMEEGDKLVLLVPVRKQGNAV